MGRAAGPRRARRRRRRGLDLGRRRDAARRPAPRLAETVARRRRRLRPPGIRFRGQGFRRWRLRRAGGQAERGMGGREHPAHLLRAWRGPGDALGLCADRPAMEARRTVRGGANRVRGRGERHFGVRRTGPLGDAAALGVRPPHKLFRLRSLGRRSRSAHADRRARRRGQGRAWRLVAGEAALRVDAGRRHLSGGRAARRAAGAAGRIHDAVRARGDARARRLHLDRPQAGAVDARRSRPGVRRADARRQLAPGAARRRA